MSASKSKQAKVQTFKLNAPPDLERMLADARSVKHIGETMRVKARAVRSLLLYLIDHHGGWPAIDPDVCEDLVNPAAKIAEEIVAMADELFDATQYLPGNIERLRPAEVVRA